MFAQPDKGGWSLCPDYDTIVHTNCCRLVSPCGFIVILFMSNCHYLHFYVCVCEDFLFKHLTIIDNRSAWSHPLSAVDYSAQGCKDNPRLKININMYAGGPFSNSMSDLAAQLTHQKRCSAVPRMVVCCPRLLQCSNLWRVKLKSDEITDTGDITACGGEPRGH